MSNDFSTGMDSGSTDLDRVVEKPKSVTKRRSPKTIDEQVAEAMAKADALKAKALEQRDRLRSVLIEDLYSRYGIGGIDGDVSERERLAALREQLGLGR